MFLIMLGGSLVLGAGLLAAASYSEGAFVAIRTAAQVIGWLFLLATLIGLSGLRRATSGQLTAATVTLASGLAVLYLSYFHWGTMPDAPIRYAAAEDLPVRQVVYKVIEDVTAAPEAISRTKVVVAAIAPVPAVADACASLKGLESLQCKRRCSEKAGLSWMACQESARLEYCDGRQADEASCPGPSPYSPPG